MNIRMLGTGGAFSKLYDNNNGLLEHNGFRLLVDCGISLPKCLYDRELSFNDLDGVLISHIHGDHVGGLEEYGFQMMFKYKRKPVLYIADTLIEPLWEYTLRGGMAQGPFNSLEDYFDVRPLQEEVSYTIAQGLEVKLLRTEHIPNKQSYSFIFNNHFFYSADMKYNAPLLKRLVDQGIDTIYHDCQLETPGAVHASLEELLELPEHIQRLTWLMHYGDTMDQYRGRTGFMRIVERDHRYEL